VPPRRDPTDLAHFAEAPAEDLRGYVGHLSRDLAIDLRALVTQPTCSRSTATRAVSDDVPVPTPRLWQQMLRSPASRFVAGSRGIQEGSSAGFDISRGWPVAMNGRTASSTAWLPQARGQATVA
jgi:hypothetical protein